MFIVILLISLLTEHQIQFLSSSSKPRLNLHSNLNAGEKAWILEDSLYSKDSFYVQKI